MIVLFGAVVCISKGHTLFHSLTHQKVAGSPISNSTSATPKRERKFITQAVKLTPFVRAAIGRGQLKF